MKTHRVIPSYVGNNIIDYAVVEVGDPSKVLQTFPTMAQAEEAMAKMQAETMIRNP